MLKQMNDFFQVMHAQKEASSSNQRDRRPSRGGDTSTGIVQPKPVRLEFLKYDRVENSTKWLCLLNNTLSFKGQRRTRKCVWHLTIWREMPKCRFKGRRFYGHRWNRTSLKQSSCFGLVRLFMRTALVSSISFGRLPP